jgi:hypothetical protein
MWAILAVAFCYVYVYNFFQTWFHTFLVRGRNFTESENRSCRGTRAQPPVAG